jgi:signal transduction histidine kinase
MVDILVIEDNALMRQLLIESLEVNGFATHEATNGDEGLQKAREILPDIILSDLRMPVMDGHALLREIRGDPQLATTPFIVLTANDARADTRQAMEEGADDYITKPFAPDELLKAVTAQLKKQVQFGEKYSTSLRSVVNNIAYALPHELRTPLTSILGFSGFLEEDYDKPEVVRDYAHRIQNAGKRLQRVIENYLIYAQIEILSADPAQLEALRNHVTESCGYIIRQEAEDVAQEFERSQDLKLALDDPSLRIAEKDLRKIVWELVENAFKFSEPGTPVKVSAVADDTTYTLSITDQGRGMTREQIKSIGEFMQFERAVNEQQGLGLGLAIALRLVDIHRGQFDIQSVPGSGTVVSVRFPCR